MVMGAPEEIHSIESRTSCQQDSISSPLKGFATQTRIDHPAEMDVFLLSESELVPFPVGT
jgi:hypothetical protein